MANCAIVGINWGDEGKGRMVVYLTSHYDVVVRYQGGGNAGHTVVNDKGTFALHLLPSGIFREGVVNILGNGVALDCENLLNEMNTIRAAGVSITPENLKISDRASLLLPWHRELDGLEEARLADKKYGSTKQGIAPFYSDKYQKKTVMAGELLHPQHLKEHLADLLEWKNLTLQKVYGAKTGRPRRVGPIDLVATRYGVQVQGATNIALTKLDILSYMDKIPVCAHYELDGQQTDEFPFPVCLQDAKPVTEYLEGWKCDISKARSWDELPENARKYVEYVEQAIGCHIGYVSVGAERDSLIIR